MNYPRILVLDNYDSFTFNIVHYLEKLNAEVRVVRNDKFEMDSIDNYDKIILSPGPGLPKGAGKMMEVIKEYYDKKPILGICLGMQAIAEFFDGRLYNQNQVKHGVQESIKTEKSKLYQNIPQEINVGLYHSWAVEISTSTELIPTAFSKENILMSIEHKQLPIVGVQYHPESIMTDYGIYLLDNFIKNY